MKPYKEWGEGHNVLEQKKPQDELAVFGRPSAGGKALETTEDYDISRARFCAILLCTFANPTVSMERKNTLKSPYTQ